jgi:2-succinyl-5-enolpyruvyl-6-hydroxy-3-cyclohexene-1-carboxylate synthase
VPEDLPGAGRYWRSVGARSWAAALGPPAGPVHLNLAFREPLVPSGAPVVDVPGRASDRPWVVTPVRRSPPHPDDVATVIAAVEAHPRGLVVAGWGSNASPEVVDRFAWAAGWPVLADAVSGLRSGFAAISAYDPLLRGESFAARWKPEFVLHFGAPLTNRAATAWLDESIPRLVVDPDGAWLDPHRAAAYRLVTDPDGLLTEVVDRLSGRDPDREWLEGWRKAEASARGTIDGLLDVWDVPFEGRVVRDVAGCLPDGASLVIGSSMPVRDAESFVAPRSGLRWLSNRGVNGIDGFVSTVLGVAATVPPPVVGLLGDLTLLHDVGGLLAAARRGLDAVLVVLDNDGGGVFTFLPQADLPEHFETLFGTPHGIDLLTVAGAFGVPGVRVTRAVDVVPAVTEAIAAGGLRLVVIPTDRVENVRRHRRVWTAVAQAVEHSA